MPFLESRQEHSIAPIFLVEGKIIDIHYLLGYVFCVVSKTVLGIQGERLLATIKIKLPSPLLIDSEGIVRKLPASPSGSGQ